MRTTRAAAGEEQTTQAIAVSPMQRVLMAAQYRSAPDLGQRTGALEVDRL
jgi:hypothetical protein